MRREYRCVDEHLQIPTILSDSESWYSFLCYSSFPCMAIYMAILDKISFRLRGYYASWMGFHSVNVCFTVSMTQRWQTVAFISKTLCKSFFKLVFPMLNLLIGAVCQTCWIVMCMNMRIAEKACFWHFCPTQSVNIHLFVSPGAFISAAQAN